MNIKNGSLLIKNEPCYTTLTECQKGFLNTFFSQQNVLLTGGAGVGKSFIINFLFSFLKKNSVISYKTASTGVAALLIEGSTIHSFAGIGLGDESGDQLLKTVKRNKKAVRRIRNAQVLCIDEISMVKASLLDKLDWVFRQIRLNPSPFGGIKMLFCGDALQMPPIIRGMDSEDGFFFKSLAWKAAKFKICELKEIVRQKDPVFAKLLSEIRVGNLSNINLLSNRIGAKFENLTIKPVKIFCKNRDVDKYNQLQLEIIKAPSKKFIAVEDGPEHYKKFFDKNCQAPTVLELKVEAQVMLLRNQEPGSGLVNGSIGKVLNFNSDGVTVKFNNGKEYVVEPETWEIKEQDVGFDNQIFLRVVASRKQIPLKLCWACSVHKSQGATFSHAEIDVSEAFSSGQVYVALSRVESLEGLSVLPFSEDKIIVSQEALNFYEKIKELN
jgi:ATP-dependent exoDNAse (exonuclease V) alpha subunit